MTVPSGPRLILVFPASAGVIPGGWLLMRAKKRFPRIRGGDPVEWGCCLRKHTFSPHPRG